MATPVLSLSQVREIIQALDAEFVRHANAGDVERMVDGFYAEDAQLLPPDAPKVTGKAAILEFWRAVMATGPKDITIETTDIAASGDIAYGVGKYAMTAADGRHEGKYVIVLRRQPDGGYKTVVDMFSENS